MMSAMGESAAGPAWRRIASSYAGRITKGQIAPGERLPSIRVAAQDWGVAEGTIRRAWQELAEQGLVEGQQGFGVVVKQATAAPHLTLESLAEAHAATVTRVEALEAEVRTLRDR